MPQPDEEAALTAEQIRELQRRVEEKLLNEIVTKIGRDDLLDTCAAYKAFKEALIT